MDFVTSLLIPLLRDKSIDNLSLQVFLLLMINLILLSILIISWTIGLKKYEAFCKSYFL